MWQAWVQTSDTSLKPSDSIRNVWTACAAGGIRGHMKGRSLKYGLPKN